MNFIIEELHPLRYLLTLPRAGRLAGGTTWPVVCFLHGYDEGPPTALEDGLTRHGPLRPGNPEKIQESFIVVAPQLPVRGDGWHHYALAVEEIIRHVQRSHGGDHLRTYLTGFSYGGNGVFDLALRQPGLWAALWAVDPTRVPERDSGLPVWLSFGEVARRLKEGFVHSLGLSADVDGERVYSDEGADHVGAATQAYADERLYDWLLSKQLSPQPQSI